MYICIYIYVCPPYTCITIYAHLMGKTGSSKFENVQKIISPKQQQGRLQRHPQVSNFLQGFEAEIFPVVMHIHLVTRRSLVLSPPKKKLGRSCRVIFFWFFLKRQKKNGPEGRCGNGWRFGGCVQVKPMACFEFSITAPVPVLSVQICRIHVMILKKNHLPMPNTRHGSNQAVCLIIRFREG